MQRSALLLLTSSAISLSFIVQPMHVKTANAQQVTLEEIVVTARKRQESLLEVPLAISAIGAAQIDKANLTNLQDIQQIAPSFFFQDGLNQLRNDRASRFYVVRGLAFGTAITTEAVTVFLDGAPLVGAGEPGTMVDVDRVEILRGPQAAYFGRNTYAGAINIVTKRPGNELGGQIEAERAQYGSLVFSGSVDIPLMEDKLAVRLSGRSEDIGGQYTNAFDGTTLGDRKTNQLSGSLYATPSDNFSLKAYVSRYEFDDGPDARFAFLSDQRTCNAGGTQTWICGNPPGYNPDELAFNLIVDDRVRDNVFAASYFGQPLRDEGGTTTISWLANIGATYDLDNGMSIDFVAARNKKETSLISDEDNRDTLNVPNPLFGLPGRDTRSFRNELAFIDRAVDDWSAELRLTSSQDKALRYTMGVSYLESEALNSYLYGDGFAGFRIPSSSGIVNVETKAIFGGIYYDITDRLTFSLEARQQWDDIRSTPFNQSVPNAPLTLADPLDATFKNLGPRIILDYQVTDDVMLYTSWARGFLPGGFNARLLTLTSAQVAELQTQIDIGPFVDEESQDTYELGVRAAFLDGRAFVNATAYLGSVSDHQITQSGFVTQASGQQLAINGVVNGGEVDFWGLELESNINLTDQFSLSGSFAWNHSEYTVHNCINCQSYLGVDPLTGGVGNDVENSPDYTASLIASYQDQLTSEFDWYVSGEYFYTDGFWVTDANLLKTETRNIANVRFGVESESLRVEAYVKNITNNDNYPSVATTFDRFAGFARTPIAKLAEKRRWGIRTKYSF